MNEILTRRTLILIAAAGSAALMLGALGFQYIGGMPPCKLCLWQRYPHVAAILIGAVALALPRASLALAGAAATLTTAGIGAYHTGVERGWWRGPSACSGGAGGNLLRLDGPLDIVMCDEVAWQMLGLSMASWNMLASLALAMIWAMAARR